MIDALDFCTAHWALPYLLSFVIGSVFGWLLNFGKGPKTTVIEEKIIYQDKIVYQDKIIYRDKTNNEKSTEAKEEANQIEDHGPSDTDNASIASRAPHILSDYLEDEKYLGHPKSDTINNIALFENSENSLFYFVKYNDDDTVLIKSKGFATAKDRDFCLSEVFDKLNSPKDFESVNENNKTYYVIKNAENIELGRSPENS